MNLIVRVKRRRSQEPTESICIVDDAGAPAKKRSTARQLTESLSALSTSNNEKEQSKTSNQKLFLRRIQTVEVGGEAELDKRALSASVSLSQKRGRDEVDIPINPEKERTEGNESSESYSSTTVEYNQEKKSTTITDQSCMWITGGKKVLRSNYTLEKFVVVDVTQVPFARPSQIVSNTLSKDKNNQETGQNHQETGQKSTLNSPGNVKKSIVIDPATRKLDAAIEKAFKFNDFNDMAQALQIGNWNLESFHFCVGG